MDVSFDRDNNTLTINDEQIMLPSTPWSFKIFDEILVIRLAKSEETTVNADFQLPTSHRNLVAFDSRGRHKWTVEPLTIADVDRYYDRVYRFLDRCVVRRIDPKNSDDDGVWVEVDKETGEILNSFPTNSFQVGTDLRWYSEPVYPFTFQEQLGMIIEPREGYYENYVTAFDTEENELWRENFVSSRLKESDGKLIADYEGGMGRYVAIEYDPNTGKPLRIHNSVFSTREHLEDYIPESLHYLIDGYLE